MNECLTTPQHEKQIGYWVSEKGKCMKWLYNKKLRNIINHSEDVFLYYLAGRSVY